MLRVLATIMRSEFSSALKKQQVDLTNWVKEIHSGMYSNLVSLSFLIDSSSSTSPALPCLRFITQDNTYLFRNYADDNSTFYDAASTALLASTVYRISVLRGDHSHIAQAEASRKALSWSNSSYGSGTQHITADGWLTPVVNPLEYGVEGSNSPEGEAFVLEMQAAWRDWVAAGSKGVSGAGMTVTRTMVERLVLPIAVGAAVLWM
jgi:hypothetical protein